MHELWKDDAVDGAENLWRYFPPDRFISMLDSRTLYFASARQFDDPFEGATAVVVPHPIDSRFEPLEGPDKAFEELRRLTKVSCWNRGDHESEAMWKLYASERKGVAVRTTSKDLAASLQPFRLRADYAEEEPYWGNVRYFDLTRVRLKIHEIERFFCKHNAFSSEREFRIAISLRMAEEFGVSVPEKGISVSFEPKALITAVILGPNLTGEERLNVSAAVEGAGLRDRMSDSTLLWRPRYI